MSKRIRILFCLVVAFLFVLCVFTACNTTTIQSVKFKITFDVDGRNYFEINTQGTEVLQMPNNPTKDDYIFDGWYWDKDTWTRPFTANSLLNEPLKADMTVYAKWKRDCNHNIVTDKGYAPTCTKDGLTDGSHCDICGDTIVAQEVIPASGHDIKQADAKSPTCTAAGWNAYEYCTKCDYTTKVEIKANGHTESDWIVDVAPKCLTGGHRHKVCEVCHIIVAEEDTDALQHDIQQAKAQAPTCTEVGWNAYEYCTRCDYTTKVEIKANGHTEGGWIVDVEPSCETKGHKHKDCTVCGDLLQEEDIVATGHHFSSEWESDETYHWHDADCGHNLTSEKVKHSFDANWKCTVCNYQDISLHGTELKAKTLSVDGANLYTKVSNTTETFSFINEIQVAEGALYTVHTDISCSGASELRAKTAPLSVGDNVLYILVSNGNDVALYTTTIRRRPIYTVSFEPNNGTQLENLQVEEDEIVDIPTIDRKGYIFDGWDFDFSNAITQNVCASASWTIKKYTITYVLNGGIDCNNVTEYTIEDDVIKLNDGIGNSLFCGWYLENAFETYIDNIDPIDCKNYILYALFDGTEGLIISNGTVKGYNGDSIQVNIPAYYKGIAVTTISSVNNKTINGVVIPNSVTNIGSEAFSGCSWLTNITIPDSVTSIDGRAFENCRGLKSVIIGNGVKNIGPLAFSECSRLTAVHISDLKKWCEISFYNNSANPLYYAHNLYLNGKLVTELDIPDTVTKINNYSFIDCIPLTSVFISDSVMSIGDYVFSGCSGLTSITIPDSVTNIGGCAFSGCSGLTSVNIGNGVKSIGGGAFSGCCELTSITIPDNVESIGGGILSGCVALESVSLPFIGGDRESSSVNLFGYFFERKSQFAGGKEWEFKMSTGYTWQGTKPDNTPNSVWCYLIPTSIRTVNITNAKYIYDYAFYNCDLINEIVINQQVLSIGKYAFGFCSGLTSISIPQSVTSIADYAFYDCSGLESISIGSVRSIGINAIAGCISLNAVHITNIATWCAISYNNGYDNPLCRAHNLYLNGELVTDLVIPNGVTRISNYAFYDYSELASITIPDSVTNIGISAFSGCSGLINITVSNGNSKYHSANNCLIETATKNIILGCKNSIIPNDGSVTSIGEYAFNGCSGLTSISIPDCVTNIGAGAFYGCSSIRYNEYDNALYLGNSQNPFVALIKANDTSIISCITHQSTKIIYSGAFSGCSELTSVIISNNVTNIGEGAFKYCSGLEEITIPFVGGSRKTASDTYQYPFGYIFGTSSYTGGTATKQYYYGNSTSSITNTTYYIPTSLKKVTVMGGNILYGAFYNCSNLTSITIPDSVTSIGKEAFSGCSSLTSITIPDSVTSIGKEAFSGCSSLTSITIPDSVTSIDDYAFKDCNNITSATLPVFAISYISKSNLLTVVITSGESICDNEFYGCSGLTSITIPNSMTSIGSYAFYNCSGLTSVTIPESVASIGQQAFRGCSGLTSITIPDSVTSIGWGAFKDCTRLTNITIPFVGEAKDGANKTSFGYIFGGASNNSNNSTYVPSSLRQVTITGGTSIASSAFFGCSSLVSVTIDSATSIGSSAFKDCSSLTNVIIGNGVTNIGVYAFNGCSKLTNVTMGDGVTSIEYGAFNNCPGIKGVYYNSTESDWKNISIAEYNTQLTKATRYYYSEEHPVDDGNYWHYVDGVITVWAKQST